MVIKNSLHFINTICRLITEKTKKQNNMKKIIFLTFLAGLLFTASCEEDPKSVLSSEPMGAIVTTPEAGDQLVLTLADSAEYIHFAWDKADFGFSSAPTYLVQIDKAGGDFTEALTIMTTSSSADSLMVYKFDELLFNNGYEGEVAVDVDVRIRAILKGIESSPFADTVFSALQRFTVTPFTIVSVGPPPSIFMIGAATGGWNTDKAVEVAPTDVKNKFSTTAYFDVANGKSFRFFSAKNWDASIGGYDIFPNFPAGTLEKSTDNDPNFNFIGTPGWFVITADVNTGTITMTAVAEPLLYLTGDATHGWDFGSAAKPLKWIGHQIWQGNVAFTQSKYFRIFEQADWGPVSYGYNIVTKYNTDIIIVAAGHSDPNWQFIAATGTYLVKVDKRNASIVITPAVP
jgi:starch-binding outer membrane protein SusE/F